MEVSNVPLNFKFLTLDLHELYHRKDSSLEKVHSEIVRLINESIVSSDGNILTADDSVRLVGTFFQLDCLIEHILVCRGITEKQPLFDRVLRFRHELYAKVKEDFKHYWLALDVISQCPSYHISKMDVSFPKSSKISIPTFLNQVSELGKIIYIDPFEALHTRNAAIALLGSRLKDPQTPESDKQFWISTFLDNTFWMSPARIAHCLAAMICAERFKELEALQYHFELPSWKYASALIPSGMKLPRFLEVLLYQKSQEISPLNIFSNDLLKFLRQASLANFFEMGFNIKNQQRTKIEIISALFAKLSLTDIFNEGKRMVDFVIVSAILSPETTRLDERFPKFMSKIRNHATYDVVFSADSQILSAKTFKPIFPFKNVVKATSSTFIPIVYNAVVMATRNLSTFFMASNSMDDNYPACVTFNENAEVTKFHRLSGAELFIAYCNLLVIYDITNINILDTLNKLHLFEDLYNPQKLTAHMRCLLVEYIIASHIIQQAKVPKEFLAIRGSYSLSRTVGRLRGISEITPSLRIVQGDPHVLHELQSRNYNVHAVLITALLPMVMDGPEGLQKFYQLLISLPMHIQSNIMPMHQATVLMLHEFEQEDNLEIAKNILMKLQSVLKLFSVELSSYWGIRLSAPQKRKCLEIYAPKETLGMLFSALKRINDLDMSYLIGYLAGKNRFDIHKISSGIAALITNSMLGKQSIFRIPESLAEAILLPNDEKRDFDEIATNVNFILAPIVNLSFLTLEQRTFLIQEISAANMKDKQLRVDYERLFPVQKIEVANVPEEKRLNERHNNIQEITMIEKKDERPARNREAVKKTRIVKNAIEPKPKTSTKNDSEVAPQMIDPNAKSSEVTNNQIADNENITRNDEKFRNCRLTLDMIRQNVEFKEDGQVLPKPFPSSSFQKCVMQYLESETPLPFLLTRQFFFFVTTGRKFADYSDGKSAWKLIKTKFTKPENRVSIWKPKVHPVKSFLYGHGREDNSIFKTTLLGMQPITLGRLQSLVFFSSRMLHRDIRVKVDANSVYCIRSGWLYVPQWRNASAFKEGIEKLVSGNSEGSDGQVKNDVSKYVPSSKRLDKKKKKKEELKNVKQEVDFTLGEESEAILEKVEKKPETKVKNLVDEKIEELLETDELTPSVRPAIKGSKNLFQLATKFEKYTNNILPENFDSYFLVLKELFESEEVEYVAFDCEMTGLYTTADEAAHDRDPATVFFENTNKLIRAAKRHSVFQLGLLLKMKSGEYSVWNFLTDPTLSAEKFTPGTLKFLFTDPLTLKNHKWTSDIAGLVRLKLYEISCRSINSRQLKRITDLLLSNNLTLITFSGYVDLLHIMKASYSSAVLDDLHHAAVEESIPNVFYDVKYVALQQQDRMPNIKPKLEKLVKYYCPYLRVGEENLHNAPFDALLTALLFEVFKSMRQDLLVESQNKLFRFSD